MAGYGETDITVRIGHWPKITHRPSRLDKLVQLSLALRDRQLLPGFVYVSLLCRDRIELEDDLAGSPSQEFLQNLPVR